MRLKRRLVTIAIAFITLFYGFIEVSANSDGSEMLGISSLDQETIDMINKEHEYSEFKEYTYSYNDDELFAINYNLTYFKETFPIKEKTKEDISNDYINLNNILLDKSKEDSKEDIKEDIKSQANWGMFFIAIILLMVLLIDKYWIVER